MLTVSRQRQAEDVGFGVLAVEGDLELVSDQCAAELNIAGREFCACCKPRAMERGLHLLGLMQLQAMQTQVALAAERDVGDQIEPGFTGIRDVDETLDNFGARAGFELDPESKLRSQLPSRADED